MIKTTICSYDLAAYDFRSIIADYLGVQVLENLDPVEAQLTKETDTSTQYHKAFYAAIDDINGRGAAFNKLYKRFVTEQIRPLYNGAILYQSLPTFRVHLPGNVCTFEFHADSDYGHAIEEENFSLPVTKTYGTNAIWIESEVNKADYLPIEMEIGDYVRFKGSVLRHGTKTNNTKQSRVSFDFRIISKSDYKEGGAVSLHRKLPFAIGGYYSLMD